MQLCITRHWNKHAPEMSLFTYLLFVQICSYMSYILNCVCLGVLMFVVVICHVYKCILFYQIRCLLKKPLPVEVGAVVTGTVVFKANDRSATD